MAAPRFYIATPWTDLVERVRDGLIDRGWKLTYDWSSYGRADDGPKRMSKVARHRLAGVFNAHAVVVLLPAGAEAHVELGAALGLGRKVFIHASTPEGLTSEPSVYHHIGWRDDPLGPEEPDPPPKHPSDVQVITGPIRGLFAAMEQWWAVVEESMMVSRVTSVELGFYGRGRHWTQANREPAAAFIANREYMGPADAEQGVPADLTPTQRIGMRMIAIIDHGHGQVPISDEVWNNLCSALLGPE